MSAEGYLKEILGTSDLEEVPYKNESVIEIYKHTVKLTTETDKLPNPLLSHPAVDKLCDVISLLNGFLASRYTIYQLVNSPNFIAFMKSFKSKLFGFLLKSRLFELDKIKKTFLFLLNIETNALNEFLKGSGAIVRFFYSHLNYNSKTSFNLLPMRTQMEFARILCANYQRIKVILGDPNAVSLVFDSTAAKHSGLRQYVQAQPNAS